MNLSETTQNDQPETLSFQDVDQIHLAIASEIEKEGDFVSAFPIASSFYFTLQKNVGSTHLPNFYFTLYKFLRQEIESTNEDFLDLYPRSLNLYHSMKKLKKEDIGTISTDDERTAEKLAKKGVNVSLRKEQEDEESRGNQEIPSQELEKLAEIVQSVLLEGLRSIGEEISSSTHSGLPPNGIQIIVEFKNKEKETWRYEVRDNDKLILLGSIPEEVIADVEVLPSGEVRVNKPVLIDNITNYLNRSYISEEDKHQEPDTHATKNYDDVEAGVTEKISIGHHDNEAGMMKQSAYEIVEYGHKLLELFELHDSLDQQVDYPHWFQSLIVRGRDYVGKAAHYLEFKQKEMEAMQEPEREYDEEPLVALSEKAFSLGILSELERKAIERACQEGHFSLVKEYLKKKIEAKKSTR